MIPRRFTVSETSADRLGAVRISRLPLEQIPLLYRLVVISSGLIATAEDAPQPCGYLRIPPCRKPFVVFSLL
jgi:hypothetical protein